VAKKAENEGSFSSTDDGNVVNACKYPITLLCKPRDRKIKKKSFVPFCIPTVRGMFEKLFDNNSSLFDTHPCPSAK